MIDLYVTDFFLSYRFLECQQPFKVVFKHLLPFMFFFQFIGFRKFFFQHKSVQSFSSVASVDVGKSQHSSVRKNCGSTRNKSSRYIVSQVLISFNVQYKDGLDQYIYSYIGRGQSLYLSWNPFHPPR